MNYDYLVAKANDEPSKNDKFCVSCFTLIGSLVCLTKCEEYKLTKPQGLTLHVTVPETIPHGFPVDYPRSKVCLLTAPAGIILPENDIGHSNVCEKIDDIDEANDLVIE